MLSLEANVAVATRAVRSLLTDFGVESGLWLLPDISGGLNSNPDSVERLFPHSMPLSDSDHLLHHVMTELEIGFSAVEKDVWATFDCQLSGLAKVFSKRDHCELYVKANILDNDRIPQESKKSLCNMFLSTCPSYCKSRWHYAFDVMHWLGKREALIQWLEPEAAAVGAGGGAEDGLSKTEGEGLRKLACDPEERAIFWAVFWSSYYIQAWGYKVHTWLHECPCPNHQNKERTQQKRKRKGQDKGGAGEVPSDMGEHCKLKGRRMIELACGKSEEFANELHQLQLENYAPASAALRKLRAMGAAQASIADSIANAFLVAQRKVLLRFKQGTSFYSSFPWSLISLLGYVVQPSGQTRARAIQTSRRYADELCARFDANQLQISGFASRFFEGDLLQSLRSWGRGSADDAMNNHLFRELLSYGLSLTAMQRLEGRHHLVNLKVGPSRASAAATVSAALRRRQNTDVHQDSFRQTFERNLQRFHLLVPERWNSMAELHRYVSGQHVEVMFQDVTRVDAIIAQHGPGSDSRAFAGAGTDADLVLFQQHLKTVLREGFCYAVPVGLDSGITQYDLVQVLSLKPAAKKYMERVVGLEWTGAPDKWQDHLAVAVLGRCEATETPGTINLDPTETEDQLCPYPVDKPFVATSSTVDPYPLQQFFKFNFEHVYQFQRCSHTCKFAENSILDDFLLDSDDDMDASSNLTVSAVDPIFTGPLTLAGQFQLARVTSQQLNGL